MPFVLFISWHRHPSVSSSYVPCLPPMPSPLWQLIHSFFCKWGNFHLFWVSHISGWQIGRHDKASTTCSLSILGSVKFHHCLLVDQTWLIIYKHKIRDDAIIIHDISGNVIWVTIVTVIIVQYWICLLL